MENLVILINIVLFFFYFLYNWVVLKNFLSPFRHVFASHRVKSTFTDSTASLQSVELFLLSHVTQQSKQNIEPIEPVITTLQQMTRERQYWQPQFIRGGVPEDSYKTNFCIIRGEYAVQSVSKMNATHTLSLPCLPCIL